MHSFFRWGRNDKKIIAATWAFKAAMDVVAAHHRREPVGEQHASQRGPKHHELFR